MRLFRRKFLERGLAACVATTAFAARASQPQTTSGSAPATTSEAPIGFDVFLEQRGYTAAPSASLITGQAFNGGLRYDEDLSAISAKTFVKQRIARVEDANRKSRPGTLPFFTVIGLDTSAPDLARTATELVLAYLTSVVGLDPARLRATTTMRSSTFFPILANHGIAAAQVRLRPWDEAVKDGLGSGYYAPVGHPSNPGATSFSLEYVMPSGLDLEIAEITHSDGNGRSGGGIGVERVEMARTGQFPAWKSTLDALSQALQDEAQHTGASLPPGLAALTRSATPSL